MRLRNTGILFALIAVIGLVAACGAAHAQSDFVAPGSDLDLSLPDYLAKAGPQAKLVAAGKLKLDKHRMVCGRRPTVIDPNFESWGGAYPGFVILNPNRLQTLPTPVKLFIYAHECGHQFVGRDEMAADCFGVKRGRRYGWLNEKGLDQVCAFISRLKGDAEHPDGPERCNKIRSCYREAAPRASRTGQNPR